MPWGCIGDRRRDGMNAKLGGVKRNEFEVECYIRLGVAAHEKVACCFARKSD